MHLSKTGWTQLTGATSSALIFCMSSCALFFAGPVPRLLHRGTHGQAHGYAACLGGSDAQKRCVRLCCSGVCAEAYLGHKYATQRLAALLLRLLHRKQ